MCTVISLTISTLGLPLSLDAHYDISNDLFRTFLDKETLMYSSAIYDAMSAPPPKIGQPSAGLVFKGTLEEAQWRKLDTLCDRAQLHQGQQLLDIGFGWGGLSIHAAKVSQFIKKIPIRCFPTILMSNIFTPIEIWLPCHWYHVECRTEGLGRGTCEKRGRGASCEL